MNANPVHPTEKMDANLNLPGKAILNVLVWLLTSLRTMSKVSVAQATLQEERAFQRPHIHKRVQSGGK